MKNCMKTTNCNLCGADNFTDYYKQMDYRFLETPRDLFTLVKCNECGLIYLNPRPDKEYLQVFYPDAFYQGRTLDKENRSGLLKRFVDSVDLVTVRRKQAIKEKVSIVINNSPEKVGRILDIGSAAGEFLFAMKKKGWDVMGTEMSATMCEYVQKTYDISCINTDINDLGADELEANSFDVITLWATLEHLYDPKMALKLCHQSLKPGGKIVILVPNANSLEEKLFRKSNPNIIDIPRHFYHFNVESINKYFTDVGFEIEKDLHFTLNASDKFSTIIDSIVGKIPPKNRFLKTIRLLLSNIGLLFGDLIAMFLSLFKRSHSIIVVGRKK